MSSIDIGQWKFSNSPLKPNGTVSLICEIHKKKQNWVECHAFESALRNYFLVVGCRFFFSYARPKCNASHAMSIRWGETKCEREKMSVVNFNRQHYVMVSMVFVCIFSRFYYLIFSFLFGLSISFRFIYWGPCVYSIRPTTTSKKKTIRNAKVWNRNQKERNETELKRNTIRISHVILCAMQLPALKLYVITFYVSSSNFCWFFFLFISILWGNNGIEDVYGKRERERERGGYVNYSNNLMKFK